LVELSARARHMLERVTEILAGYLGKRPKPEEVVELALERLLQEFDARYDPVWY